MLLCGPLQPSRTVSMMSNWESMPTAASTFGESPVIMAVMEEGVRSTVSTKCLDDLQRVRALLSVDHEEFNQEHFLHHRICGRVLIAVHHIDKLGHLLHDLLEPSGATLEADRHTAESEDLAPERRQETRYCNHVLQRLDRFGINTPALLFTKIERVW